IRPSTAVSNDLTPVSLFCPIIRNVMGHYRREVVSSTERFLGIFLSSCNLFLPCLSTDQFEQISIFQAPPRIRV
ncbi:MAG: hypothetical protein JW900_14390, partial [Anaerolineae bacterium]|nr:hypothetical protein [Anaerolineae bacterium]